TSEPPSGVKLNVPASNVGELSDPRYNWGPAKSKPVAARPPPLPELKNSRSNGLFEDVFAMLSRVKLKLASDIEGVGLLFKSQLMSGVAGLRTEERRVGKDGT